MVFDAEGSLHQLIGVSFDKEKEFFRISPDTALHFMQQIARNNPLYKVVVHPDLESAVEKKKSSMTTFSMLDIPVGSRIFMSRNGQTIECEVADDKNTILYKGEKTTVSAVAKLVLGYGINGFSVFMYEHETLWQRRERLMKS